jgi:hypothetical protein
VVPDREIDIALLPKSPPLPPKTTKTMRPQWMDESTVRIDSCPATGIRNSDCDGRYRRIWGYWVSRRPRRRLSGDRTCAPRLSHPTNVIAVKDDHYETNTFSEFRHHQSRHNRSSTVRCGPIPRYFDLQGSANTRGDQRVVVGSPMSLHVKDRTTTGEETLSHPT